MPEFPTITHVALTVSDLNRSVPWYEELFSAKPVLDEDTGPFRHVVWAVGSTLVGLHQFPCGKSEPFDERRVGLGHVAFACANRSELQHWEARLNDPGVGHGGVVDAAYGSGLSFRSRQHRPRILRSTDLAAELRRAARRPSRDQRVTVVASNMQRQTELV